MQFFISHLPRWLRTRRFSKPTFRPSRAPKHWINTVFRNFYTFSRTCIFFLLTLSLLWSSFFFSSLLWFFPPLLFHPSILSEVWLLNFLRLRYFNVFQRFFEEPPFFSWGDILHMVEMNMNQVTLVGGLKVNETYKRVGGHHPRYVGEYTKYLKLPKDVVKIWIICTFYCSFQVFNFL